MAFQSARPPRLTHLDELPRLLAELRAERGVSQRLLADEAGVDASVVRRAERGRDAQLSTWVRLFGALGFVLEIKHYEIEDVADALEHETQRRKDRQDEGLCSGKWRF